MGKYIAEQTVKQLIAADKTFDNCAETVCTNQMVQQPVAQTACFSSRKLSKNWGSLRIGMMIAEWVWPDK